MRNNPFKFIDPTGNLEVEPYDQNINYNDNNFHTQLLNMDTKLYNQSIGGLYNPPNTLPIGIVNIFNNLFQSTALNGGNKVDVSSIPFYHGNSIINKLAGIFQGEGVHVTAYPLGIYFSRKLDWNNAKDLALVGHELIHWFDQKRSGFLGLPFYSNYFIHESIFKARNYREISWEKRAYYYEEKTFLPLFSSYLSFRKKKKLPEFSFGITYSPFRF